MTIRKVFALSLLAMSLALPVRADEDVSARLRTIEAKQDEILQRIAELKAEIDIVKVRTTL